MSYIPVPDDLPGIRGLLAFKPATGVRVAQLIHELLRGDSPLGAVERETIAAHVSGLNECEFCARSHSAAMHHLDQGGEPDVAASGSRLPALLALAGAVVQGGHHVTDQLVAEARATGAGDEEIHDTVLIASAFCMLNRYVDGLKAITPHDQAAYDAMGLRMALHGYLGAAPTGD
jgi:alkylhydroperoxidase family enzyme